jgi:hypothetical protein
MDGEEGRLFHSLNGHDYLSPARAREREQRRKTRKKARGDTSAVDSSKVEKHDEEPKNVDQAPKETSDTHLALIHSHLATSLSQKFVDCDTSSSGFAFDWHGKQYPISAIEDV